MSKRVKMILIIIGIIILVEILMYIIPKKNASYEVIKDGYSSYESQIISDYQQYLSFTNYINSQNKAYGKVYNFDANKYNEKYFNTGSLAIINIVTGSGMNKLKNINLTKEMLKVGKEDNKFVISNEEIVNSFSEQLDFTNIQYLYTYIDNNKNLKPFNFSGEEAFTDEELIRYAQYIEKAMELNIPDIIAHPDLFMINSKKFGKIEEKISHMICKSSEKYNIPLEINLNRIFNEIYYENKQLNNSILKVQKTKLLNVTYPCKEFWNIATKYNIRVVYGLDVHHKGQITLYNELLKLANDILGEGIIGKLNFIEEDDL